MLFSLKQPKSERFFQLSFKGFRPGGNNRIQRYAILFFGFLKSLFLYLFKKVAYILKFFGKTFSWAGISAKVLKAYAVSKLIWSRGRLGRSVSTVVVMSCAFGLFLVGKVFNSSQYVTAKELDSDYIENVVDIIPQRNIAITQIPEDRQRTEPIKYAVEQGDTLTTIGSKFKVSVDYLKYVNNFSDFIKLKPGQEITIPPVAGLSHKIGRGETLNTISRKYDVSPQVIADFNYILDTNNLVEGTELIIPGAKVPNQPVVLPLSPVVLAPSAVTDPNASKGYCVWPTTVNIIFTYFSWLHNGIDIATPHGISLPPIFSCAGGTVTRAGWDPFGLGLHIRVDHGDGYETVYGHLSRLDVSYGDSVSRGQQIGIMGSTGRSTGPHVHFTVLYKGSAQNPFNYTN